MNKNLRIPINPLIKLLIRNRRIINTDLMRNNKRGLRTARNNQVPKVSIIRFDVTLPGSKGSALHLSTSYNQGCCEVGYLLKKLPKRDKNLPLLTLRIWTAGVRREDISEESEIGLVRSAGG